MNSLRKFNFNDWFFSDVLNSPHTTFSSRGQWVDTDRYDIVPRKSYIDELIKQKEDDIAYHEEKIKVLKEEISRLGKQKQG